MIAILPVIMSFLARASGGGLYSDRVWSRLPEILFAIPFGIYAGIEYSFVCGIVGFIWSYVAMETGHGTFYKMKGYDDHNRDDRKPDAPRVQTLEKIFRPIYIRFGGDIMKPEYSWYMMAIKGALIGLPVAPFGMLLAILWPFSYWVGFKIEDSPKVAEWASGMMAGFVLALAFMF